MNEIKSRHIWILIVLLTVLFDGGYAKGNNREVVNASGNIQQLTNYYPFGAPYTDPKAVVNASLQPYKYNGKELDLMHGLNTYDYGARQYDPILCRWDRVDPLCEKYYIALVRMRIAGIVL